MNGTFGTQPILGKPIYQEEEEPRGLLGRTPEEALKVHSSATDYVSDTGITLAKGIVGAAQGAIGLADFMTSPAQFISSHLQSALKGEPRARTGYIGKAMESLVDLEEVQGSLSEHYSERASEAIRKVGETRGFLPTLKEYVKNPYAIYLGLVESTPSMAAGGGLGRFLFAPGLTKFASRLLPKLTEKGAESLLKWIPQIAAGAGEGAISTGMMMEGARSESEEGLTTVGQTTRSAVGGALVSLFGATVLGVPSHKLAKFAKKYDIDMLLSGTLTSTEDKRRLLTKLLHAGFAEGFLEELPQNIVEGIVDNLNAGRPWWSGLGGEAASGLAVGAAMGGVGAGWSHMRDRKRVQKGGDSVDLLEDAPSMEGLPIDDTPVGPAFQEDELFTPEEAAAASQPAEEPPLYGDRGVSPILGDLEGFSSGFAPQATAQEIPEPMHRPVQQEVMPPQYPASGAAGPEVFAGLSGMEAPLYGRPLQEEATPIQGAIPTDIELSSPTIGEFVPPSLTGLVEHAQSFKPQPQEPVSEAKPVSYKGLSDTEIAKLSVQGDTSAQAEVKRRAAKITQRPKKAPEQSFEEVKFKSRYGREAIKQGGEYMGLVDGLHSFKIPIDGIPVDFTLKKRESLAKGIERVTKEERAKRSDLSKTLPTFMDFIKDKGLNLPKFSREKAPAKWQEALYKANPKVGVKEYQALHSEWEDLTDKSIRAGKNMFTEPKVVPVKKTPEKKPVTAKPRRDLTPDWKIALDPNAQYNTYVDHEKKTITFRSKKDMADPAKVNELIAQAVMGKTKQSVVDTYSEAAGLESSDKNVAKRRLQMVYDFGRFINGEEVTSPVKEFFTELMSQKQGEVHEPMTPDQTTRVEHRLTEEVVKALNASLDEMPPSKLDKDVGLVRGSRVIKDFVKEKMIIFKDAVIKSTRDLAAIAQICRDERVETFRYILTDDNGKVLSMPISITSRLPNMTQALKGKGEAAAYAKYVGSIVSHAKRVGATKLYVMHNHPSGNPRVSTEDTKATLYLDYLLDKFKKRGATSLEFVGHVIINDTHYSVIHPSTGYDSMHRLPKTVVDLIGKRKELWSNRLTNDQLAEIGSGLKRKENYVTAFFLSSSRKLSHVQDIHVNQLLARESDGFFRGLAREYGAPAIIIYADSIKGISQGRVLSLIMGNSITDFIAPETGSVRMAVPGLHERALKSGMVFGEKVSNIKGIVAEETAEEKFDKTLNALQKEYAEQDGEIRSEEPSAEQAKEQAEEQQEPTEETPTMEDLAREGYADADRRAWELPEMLELIHSLTGEFPKIRKKLNNLVSQFSEKTGRIDILHSLNPEEMSKVAAHNIGYIADWVMGKAMKKGNIFAKIASINMYMKNTLAQYEGARGQPLTDEDRARIREEAKREAKKQSESLYSYVIKQVPEYAHTDITPEMVLNLLRGLSNEPKAVLDFLKSVDGPEKARIVKMAFKGVVDERIASLEGRVLKGYRTVVEAVKVEPGDLNAKIAKMFHEKLQAEIDKRKLFRLEVIMAELKEVSRKWNKFDPRRDEAYTNKRFSPKELYATAVSVLLNDPKMLRTEAPEFWKAFHNYIDARPPFKAKYDEINKRLFDREAVLENRQMWLEEGPKKAAQRRADEFARLAEKRRATVKKVIHAIRKTFDTQKLAYRIKVQDAIKRGVNIKDEHRIDYWVTQLPRISSEIYVFARDMQAVIEGIKDAAIDVTKFGVFMGLQRSAYEEGRKGIASPGGIGGESAVEQLEHMKRQMGADKYKTMEKAADVFRRIWRKAVVDVAVETKMFNKHLTDYMLNNEFYVTFDYIKENLDKRYGRGYSAQIIKQFGSFGEIENPVLSTMLKGMALIKAMRYNQTKAAILTSLIEISKNPDTEVIPAKMTKHGWESPPEGYGRIEILNQGVRQAYFIDKDLTEIWDKNDDHANAIYRIAAKYIKAPISKLFIGWNVPWILRNPVKDALGTWKKIPDSSKYILGSIKKVAGEAWRAAGGELTPLERKLLVKHAISPGRFYQSEDIFSHMYEETYKTALSYEGKLGEKNLTEFRKGMGAVSNFYQKHRRKLILPAVGDFLERTGQAGERLMKFAAADMIERMRADGIIIGEMKGIQNIAVMAGTPDIMEGGTMTKWMEIVFPFSRVAIQDFVSSSQGIRDEFRQRKASYLLKTLIANIIPKVFFYGALLGAGGDELKEAALSIPRYFRRLYTCIPLKKIGDHVIFLKVPQDYFGQIIGAVFDAVLNRDFSGSTTSALGVISEYNPYNLNPFIGAVQDLVWSYLVHGEVPSNYYGQPILSKREEAAGGIEAAKGFARHIYNSFFGSVFMTISPTGFRKGDPEIKKVHRFSALGLSSYIGISNLGMSEEITEATEKMGQARYRMRAVLDQKVKDADIYEPGMSHGSFRVRLDKLYYKLVSSKEIDPDVFTRSAFMKYYTERIYAQNKTPYLKNYIMAYTSDQKAGVILFMENEFGNSGQEYGQKIYKDFMADIKQFELYTVGVEKAYRRLKKEDKSFREAMIGK